MRFDPAEPAFRSRRPAWQAWVVAGVWLLGSSAVLWSIELQVARPAMMQGAALASWQPLPQAAEQWFATQHFGRAGVRGSLATLVHVYQPGCRCNADTDEHLARIRSEFAAQGVAFVSVAQDALRDSGAWRALAAAPAALLFDAGGRLTYVGPYSDSARCGAARGFVESVLASLARGEHPLPQPLLAVGCYCGPTPIRKGTSA